MEENMDMVPMPEGLKMDRNISMLEELKYSLDIINRTASELITGIDQQIKEIQHGKEVWERTHGKEGILLVQNSDLSKYSLLHVMGMDAAEIAEAVSAMDDDMAGVAACLESRGAWAAELANEGTREFREYHVDVRFNTDTNEIINLKAEMAGNEMAKKVLQDASGQDSIGKGPVKDIISPPAVYGHPLSYAMEHGEVEEYKASRRLERQCGKAIEEAVRQNFDGMRLKGDIVGPLVRQYGSERIAFVLANTLRQEAWDGRFSRNNKIWASEFPVPEDIMDGTDLNRGLAVGSHPAVLDGFISLFRREVLEQKRLPEGLAEAPEKQGRTGQKAGLKDMDDGDELIDLGDEKDMVLAEMKKYLKEVDAVENFKAETNRLFHKICGMDPTEIEESIKFHVQVKLEEYGIDAEVIGAAVVGSRCRGLEREDSDIDAVVELSTDEREDVLFNIFNEDGLHIGGIRADINPITAQGTGTLETYLPQVEYYLERIYAAGGESRGDGLKDRQEAPAEKASLKGRLSEKKRFISGQEKDGRTQGDINENRRGM